MAGRSRGKIPRRFLNLFQKARINPQNNIHTTLLTRLGAVAIILSVVLGLGDYYYEVEKIEDEVVDLAVQESRLLGEKILTHLPLESEDDRAAITRKLSDFVSERDIAGRGNGHFVLAEIYGSDHVMIAEYIEFDRKYVEAITEDSGHKFPAGKNVWYRKINVRDELYIQAVVDLRRPDQSLIGYFEGIYQVAPTALSEIYDRSLSSVILVVLTVIVTSIVLYPVVLALNGGLIVRSQELRAANFDLTKAKNEAEKSNQAKSEFLASMSHEFRTPLNAILGFSEMMQGQYFGPMGAEKYLEYANEIHRSGGDMLALVNEVLDISEIEVGRRSIDKEPIAAAELLTACVENFEQAAKDGGLSLSLDCSEVALPLYADKRSIIQILHNLLSNAVKFTERDGTVLVSATGANGKMTIEVRDSGVGIAAYRLRNISEPFSRHDSNPLVPQTGVGLGLSIVKALVEAHEGELNIESELGKGTIVTVTFPSAPN